MRFDLEALWQFVATKLSWNPATLIAAGGVALATLVVVFGAVLGSDEGPAEEVVVAAGPVFTPVNAPAPVPAARGGSESAPAFSGSEPDDPLSITSRVQRGLKRAGCYGGPVNGVWSRATSRAMAAFTSRVNASLPVDRPDPVLLALLETHRNETCGGEPAPNDMLRPEQARASPDDLPYAREAPPANDARGHDAEANVPPASSATSPTETAALGESDAYVGTPEGAAAVAAAAAAASAKTAKADRPPAKRRARKKNNSFARSVSKGFKQIQRSLNKLF